MQGLLVVSVTKHNMESRSINTNKFLSREITEPLFEVIDRLQYWSDKCLYERQGEKIAKERFPAYLEEVFKMNDAQLKEEAIGEFWSSRREDL